MFQFDPNSVVIAGVQLLPLVFGLVEFFKCTFNLSGKAVTILSACLGGVLMLLFELQKVLPDPYAQVYAIVITSVAFGLSASGFYKFVNKRTRTNAATGPTIGP